MHFDPQAPVAYWIPKAEQFCLAPKDGTRPFANAWRPLYDHPPAQHTISVTAYKLAEKELKSLVDENFGRMPQSEWADQVLDLRDTYDSPVPIRNQPVGAVKPALLPSPTGYLCDWGDMPEGCSRQAFYYGEPGNASKEDWNEFPKVQDNEPMFTAAQMTAYRESAMHDKLDNAAYFKGINMEQLFRALTQQGIAAPVSQKKFAAQVAEHINALTASVVRAAPGGQS